MSGTARARAVLLTVVLSSAATRAAQAEPVDPALSPPFRLVYEAPPERCPDAEAFLGAIRARTERARIAAPGDEAAVTFSVRITAPSGGRIRGRLEIREPDGTRQERAVESATCSEVAKALALVGALYLDPDATAGPIPEVPSAPPPPPPSTPPPRREPAPRPKEPRSPAATRREPGIEVGAGAGLGLSGGLGPWVAPLAGAFGEVAIDGAAISPSSLSWARLAARVSIDAAMTNADVAAGSQRYVLVAGGLRLCPVDVGVVRGLHVGPCGGLEAGVHRGTSTGVANARDQDKPWITPLATVHASLSLARSVTLEAEGGAVFPLVRTRFFLAPDVTLFRTPAIAATASAAVTVWFH